MPMFGYGKLGAPAVAGDSSGFAPRAGARARQGSRQDRLAPPLDRQGSAAPRRTPFLTALGPAAGEARRAGPVLLEERPGASAPTPPAAAGRRHRQTPARGAIRAQAFSGRPSPSRGQRLSEPAAAPAAHGVPRSAMSRRRVQWRRPVPSIRRRRRRR